MGEKKKNNRIKFILLAVLFVVIIMVAVLAAVLKETENKGTYQEMTLASLPTVTLHYASGHSTLLHGYTTEMNPVDMRDVIVPVEGDRAIPITINRYGNKVNSLRYEVRSLNGETYLDAAEITSFTESEDSLQTTLTLSSLLKSGTEYHLTLTVDTASGKARFYTRILYAETQYAAELLDFAETFSDATYNSENSMFIVNYIQPQNDSVTNDFSRTDIHSKFSMFTFAGLTVERVPGTDIRITEFEPTQMSVTFRYTIRIMDSGVWNTFDVREYFVVRYRSKKVYLLDYSRTVEEYFTPELSTLEKGRIVLGVGAGDTEVLTSSNLTYTVFTKNNELWCYNAKTNSMNLIFSFTDDTDDSLRSSYDHHKVDPVKVTDNGSVDYMVYGYMNRGTYEGQVGICFYRYDAEENAASRLFYMPVNQSELTLMTDLGTLAYVNDNDVCYLRYGDGIYSIDLNSGESVEVSVRAYPGMYAKNERGNVVAWTEGEDLTYPERLVILNMDTQTTMVVDSAEGNYVKILNFIGNDIIYGFGSQKDSVVSANIDVNQLLNRILIASTDEELTVQQEYTADRFLILSVEVYETRLTIQRAKKYYDGSIRGMEDDILLITQNIRGDTERSMIMSRVRDTIKKEYYIQVGKATNVDSQFSTLTPRFEIDKKANVIRLIHQQTNVYYVYGYGQLLAIESELNVAIREAYDVFGVVVDNELNYLWTRGTRDLIKTLSVQELTVSSDSTSLGTAIRILAAQEGVQARNVDEALKAGESPLKILNDAIGERRAINLYGCTLQEVLYFVNAGHPVMAITGNRDAVVIIGYDLDKVSIYDPVTGEVTKQSQTEAAAYFEELSHLFVSYK